MKEKRIVIGVSGASGAPLAQRLLQALQKMPDVEVHLVLTHGAEQTIRQECSCTVDEFISMADVVYDNGNIGAALASGSFWTDGMVVLPCSMKTLAGIAHGYSENLLLRAADVCLKEQRKLILVPRESPFSKIHLDNMAYLSSMPGVQIIPPMLSYYQKPQTLETVEEQLVSRILRSLGIRTDTAFEWRG